MLLSTTFLDHRWLKTLSERRLNEGLNTTRPWAFVVIDNGQPVNFSKFSEDRSVIIPKHLLPDAAHPISKIKNDLSEELVTFIADIQASPAAYWLVCACDTGGDLSGAISKWTSDMCLVPIKNMYPGHNINTSGVNKKLYNSLNPELLVKYEQDFNF